MRILLKYTLKSMGEKKFRSFLIIFAIALGGALFMTSSRLSSSIGDMYMDQITAYMGDVDLQIYLTEKSPTATISMAKCKEVLGSDAEAIVPLSYTAGEYKKPGEPDQYVNITGMNFDDYLSINQLVLAEGSVEHITAENPIVVSKETAQTLGVKLGDTIDLKIAGASRKVTIVGLAEGKGMFIQENGYIQGLMPFDRVSKFLKANGKPNNINIKLGDGVDIKGAMEKLQEVYKNYGVMQIVDEKELYDQLSMITDPFMLMTCIVIFMSIFIIYSSFKVIMLEKLPTIGTFRSVGASKGIMNAVLLLEATFYGLFGGIFACGLGVGCLYGLSGLMIQMMMGGGVEMNIVIPPTTFVLTFLLAMVMALVSTIIPIMSVSKISLKDIILNNRPHKSRTYLKTTLLGIVLIVLGFILPAIMPKEINMVGAVLGLLAMAIGIIKILPLFVFVCSEILGHVFSVLFGNIGNLASKNIKKNSSVLNSITLITIGISILLLISTLTDNINTQVMEFYKNAYRSDIRVTAYNMDRQKLRVLKRNKEIERIIPMMQTSFKIDEFNEKTISVQATEESLLSPNLVFNIPNEAELLKELQEGRNIILTKTLKRRYDLEIGQEITLPFKTQDRKYKIIGFMDTLQQNGECGLIASKYYKLDSRTQTYDILFVSTKPGTDNKALCITIAEQMDKLEAWCNARTMEELAQSDKEGNSSMMGLISIFAVLAMFIGVIGVINNLMISFIERKQNIAMLRSVGMSKFQVLRMIFIEGLGSGLIGACGGILGGVLFAQITDYILEAMQMPIHMVVEPKLFARYLIGGMVITVLGSIIPARGSSKINIIEALKYE